MPKTRLEYWQEKLNNNVKRDKINQEKLAELGWQSFIIWECETKRIDQLEAKIKYIFNSINR